MDYEYRTLSEAYAEAEERLRDDDLQRRVEAFWGGQCPPGFEQKASPKIVLAPYLGRAATSEMLFQQAVASSNLDPVIATYRKIPFTTTNSELVSCYRGPLMLPNGQNSRSWIVAPENRQGTLTPTMTIYRDDVTVYWDGISNVVYEKNRLNRSLEVDFSLWYGAQARRFGWGPNDRSKAKAYYNPLMALYASGRAVLYDSPPTEFFRRVQMPAIRRVRQELGEEPIIVCGPKVSSPDWVDLRFLDTPQARSLREKGVIKS